MSFKVGVCNLCGTGCGHFLNVQADQVIGVAPVLNHPVSKGRLCVRGWHINELLASGDRVDTPLIREKGSLRPATYEEAFSLIKSKLAALKDPATELGVIGSARSSNEDNYLLMKLAHTVFGTRNVSFSSEAGQSESLNALEEGFGIAGAIGSLSEIEHSSYILIVGSDVTKLNPIIGSSIHFAAGKGARVATICSSRTQIAKLSTRHFQQKPGSKRLVVDALAKALLEIRSDDPKFAERSFPEFARYADALGRISGDEIESTTGIRFEEIKSEARAIAAADSLMILFSSGISGLDSETIRSIVNLAQLSGKMGTKNSGLIPMAGICNLQGSFDMARALSGGHDAGRVVKLLGDSGSRLKALFVVDHDDGIIRKPERIGDLDFVVYAGGFRNKFMELADVVLPTAVFSDYDGTYTAADRRVQFSSAKTKPATGVRPAWALFRDLATAMGKPWKYEKVAEVFAEIARTVPGYDELTHADLAKGFGRYTALGICGRKFLPISAERPACATDTQFPLALMIGKAQHFWHQNNLMRKTLIPRREFDATLLLYPEGYIEISPDDAKKMQVRDKWLVNVVSSSGAMEIAVKISEDVQSGSAYIPYFINDMISGFLVKHDAAFSMGEEGIVPIRIEKV